MSKQFEEHLERASKIVSTWPEWKQTILGGSPSKKIKNEPYMFNRNLKLIAIFGTNECHCEAYRKEDCTCSTVEYEEINDMKKLIELVTYSLAGIGDVHDDPREEFLQNLLETPEFREIAFRLGWVNLKRIEEARKTVGEAGKI